MDDLLLEQYIFRLQVAMYQASLVQKAQPIQKLLREDPNEGRAQPAELVLLDELVEVDTKKFEY